MIVLNRHQCPKETLGEGLFHSSDGRGRPQFANLGIGHPDVAGQLGDLLEDLQLGVGLEPKGSAFGLGQPEGRYFGVGFGRDGSDSHVEAEGDGTLEGRRGRRQCRSRAG